MYKILYNMLTNTLSRPRLAHHSATDQNKFTTPLHPYNV